MRTPGRAGPRMFFFPLSFPFVYIFSLSFVAFFRSGGYLEEEIEEPY